MRSLGESVTKEKKKKRKTEPDDKAQSQRFKDLAKSLGANGGKDFKRAMDRLVPKKKRAKKDL